MKPSARKAAVAAWVVALASVAMPAFALVVAAARGDLGRVFGPSIVFAPSLAVVGGLVASRRPRHVIGWLLLFIGFTQGLTEGAGAYAHLAYGTGSRLPAADLASWIQAWMWMPGLGVTLTFLFLLFPNGNLPSRRWRWVAVLSAAGMLVIISTTAAVAWSMRGPALLGSAGPAPGSLADTVAKRALLVVAACALASLWSLVVRYRRAHSDERHQIKWFVYGASVFLVGASLDFIKVEGAANVTRNIGSAVGALLLPAAIGVSVLRHRLYDIDVVIGRTVVYSSMAAFITAVYVAIVVGVGTLVGGAGRSNLVLSIVATAVVAVGFQPVRERLQRFANRVVYGKRATPYDVLADFSQRVAESYTAEDVLSRMARLLAEGTGAERAEVWLRTGAVLRPAAAHPASEDRSQPMALRGEELPSIEGADRAVEVRHQGELLGALTVRMARGQSLTPIEEKLLGDLARQAGLVLKNVGLTADLQARLDDLAASRQRLVKAQDDERRRLERNLHDGAQQHLVALKVKLGLADRLLATDVVRGQAALAQLKDDADVALETLRDLARGIYPPLLAEKGLAAALESQARKAGIPVTVLAGGLGRYPQEVEGATYFCCLEALQNVQKYASATAVAIDLRVVEGVLRFEVRDDGRGFDVLTVPRGSGLQNIEDRLRALGGSMAVVSRPGAGTSISGELPVETAPAPARRVLATA